jgi:hypothetical protein
MIKSILTIGDSFTYGEELENRDLAWPYYLAKGLKADVVNQGQPSAGNTGMVRKAMKYTVTDAPVDLVVVAWSSAGRMEFADENGTFDIWPGYLGGKFTRDDQLWRFSVLEYINNYHSPEYLFQQYLINIISLQSFFKARNQKYIMLDIVGRDYYKTTYTTKMPQLASLVDPTYFIGWPNEGMAEWTQGCKRGPGGHFLEDGHKKVTTKLYEHIRNFGWLS